MQRALAIEALIRFRPIARGERIRNLLSAPHMIPVRRHIIIIALPFMDRFERDSVYNIGLCPGEVMRVQPIHMQLTSAELFTNSYRSIPFEDGASSSASLCQDVLNQLGTYAKGGAISSDLKEKIGADFLATLPKYATSNLGLIYYRLLIQEYVCRNYDDAWFNGIFGESMTQYMFRQCARINNVQCNIFIDSKDISGMKIWNNTACIKALKDALNETLPRDYYHVQLPKKIKIMSQPLVRNETYQLFMTTNIIIRYRIIRQCGPQIAALILLSFNPYL